MAISNGNYIGIGNRRTKGKGIFHKSLVDYWNFAGKSNIAMDRDICKGYKGNILNLYGFSFSEMSGYGGYAVNYNNWRYVDENASCRYNYNTVVVTNIKNSNPFCVKDQDEIPSIPYKIRVTGLTYQTLNFVYGAFESIKISKDGVYDIPAVENGFMEFSFTIESIGEHDIVIEQLPLYEGALVTDGVDDYLKLDKVGYKIGTVILKYIPLFRDNNWRYVFDVTKERCYFASSKDSGVFVTSMQYKFVGDYTYLIPRTGNNPTVSNTPLYISSHAAMKEFLSMALYEIAIYQDILTDEEVLEQIDAMNPYKLVQDYTFDKSNSDIDRDKVYNKLNPNQYIELYNFGYNLNSGYGLYKENYLSYRTYMHPADKRADLTCTDSIINITEIYNNKVKFIEKQNEASTDYSVKVTGLTDDIDLYYVAYKTDDGIEIKLVNGVNNLLAGENYIGFRTKNFTGKCDITIEQIPEYPNHLVFDGVDDTTSPIPNFNAEEGTVLVQLNPINLTGAKISPVTENGISSWQYGFWSFNNRIACRSLDNNSEQAITTKLEDSIYAFAYSPNNIDLFYNGTYLHTINNNKHSLYKFGVDSNSNQYAKLALKRIKIFNKKLTENQIRKEYNKLLNE